MPDPLAQALWCGALADGQPLRPGGDALSAHALASAAFAAGQWVLDIGCGHGQSCQRLTRLGCQAVGLDLDPARLRAAHLAQPAVAGDLRRLPFADASFDGLLAECVLSLAGYSTATLAECQRVLRPGGRVAITDLYRRAGDEGPALPAGLQGLGSQRAIIAALSEAGFTLQRWEDHSASLNSLLGQWLWSAPLDKASACACLAALRQARPGYFLLIADKAERTH